MREGILLIDDQTRIVFGNRSYLEFLNKTEREIVGQPLRDVRPGARLPEVLATGQPILHAPGWRRRATSILSICTPFGWMGPWWAGCRS